MIKFIFRVFFILIAASFTLAVLYVFELPPFPKKVQTNNNVDSQTTAQEEQKLPAELKEDKVTRNKTYDEMMERAALLEQNNFPSLAVAQYQEAYKKDSSNNKPLFEIGKIYLRTTNFTKAEDIFTDLVKQFPDSTDAKIYLGRSLIGQRKISQAKDVFNKITTASQVSKY
jgi:TolA-binding protein